MNGSTPASPASPMTRHVDLLGILYLTWGALSLVVGISVLILALGASAIIASAAQSGHTAGFAARVTALTFFLLGAGGVAWGAVHAWSGYAMRRHRSWARLVSLLLAVLNLFFLPFGTALGVYTLWVLLTEQGRRLFEPHHLSEPPVANSNSAS
jgi:hypothetical protein